MKISRVPYRASRRRSRGGFTLIEMLLCCVLLAVGVLSLVSLFVLSIQTNAESGDYAIAQSIAQQQIDQLRNDYRDSTGAVNPISPMPAVAAPQAPAAFASLPALKAATAIPASALTALPSATGTVEVKAVDSNLAAVAAPVTAALPTSLFLVTVKLDWVEPGRGSVHFATDTLMCNGGVNSS